MNVSRRPPPGGVWFAFRESEPYFFVMTPSRIGTHDPVVFQDAMFDFVRNVDWIKNGWLTDQEVSFGRIPFATSVEEDGHV